MCFSGSDPEAIRKLLKLQPSLTGATHEKFVKRDWNIEGCRKAALQLPFASYCIAIVALAGILPRWLVPLNARIDFAPWADNRFCSGRACFGSAKACPCRARACPWIARACPCSARACTCSARACPCSARACLCNAGATPSQPQPRPHDVLQHAVATRRVALALALTLVLREACGKWLAAQLV